MTPFYASEFFPLAVAILLFAGVLLFLELGRRLGRRQFEKHGDEARTGVGVVDGVVYGLLGLLIGFTFNGAAERFNERRSIIIQQVEAVRTAWHRVETLPAKAQPAIRDGFRGYLDAVLTTYAVRAGSEEEQRARAKVAHAQDALWSRSVAACLTPEGEKARMLLLPAQNTMFEAVETERLVRRVHAPPMVFGMLLVATLAGALFGGFALAKGSRRTWMHTLGVAVTLATALFVILELETPRTGLVRVDSMDSALVEVRAMMR
jgi:hypothetical protein